MTENEKEDYKNRMVALREETFKRCPILYCKKDRPMTETCMCWGWECGYGWYRSLSELSENLEALNILYYPEYRVRVQAEQVKEKFSDLCFYYTVVIDPPKPYMWLSSVLLKAYDLLSRIDYKKERVVDRPNTFRNEEEEIPSGKLREVEKNTKNCSNVSIVCRNGKWFKITRIEYIGKSHYEPTRHRFLYKVMHMFKCMSNRVYYHKANDPTDSKRNVILSYVNYVAQNLINETTRGIRNVCEECGLGIGKDRFSDECYTEGYVNRICEECAEDSGRIYVMNGKRYQNGMELKKGKEKWKKAK